jgi:hypothetical protein
MSGDFAIQRPKLIIPQMWVPGEAIEEFFPRFGSDLSKKIGKLLRMPEREKIQALQMSGSLGNYVSKAIQDLIFGKTAYAGETTIYAGLWSAAVDDTSTGATTGESAYTSYARLALTNNTTIFAAGTGTTTYTKTFPSDATKSFVTSTGTGTNNTITYLQLLNGNAGSSADKNVAWCSVTSTTINNGDTPQLAQNAITVVQD